MMSGIGSQISQFIQRSRAEARLHREDEQRLLARKIQEGLLPKSVPPLTGFTIGARSWPSYDVGGDYFDAFLMSDGSLALVIGDASGHAIGPALVIAETRAYIRAFAMTSADPSEILTLTNQRLCEDLSGSHFVTLFFGRLDPRTGSLSYAGAGHCPGYVLDPAGQIKATLTSKGMPLGIDPAGQLPPGYCRSARGGRSALSVHRWDCGSRLNRFRWTVWHRTHAGHSPDAQDGNARSNPRRDSPRGERLRAKLHSR